MSVPVRYSAAANYAVVDSGLSNTLQQEEQYHQFQQQQQQLFVCREFLNNNNNYSSNNNSSNNGIAQQQQLMQQRSSMSSSVSPSATSALPAIDNTTITIHHNNNFNMDNNNINNINIVQEGEENHRHHHHYHHHQQQYHHHQQQQQQQQQEQQMSASAIKAASQMMNADIDEEGAGGADELREAEMMKSTTSTMAAAAAAAEAANGSDNAEMRTEWRMSDEGRYGTPGAAGLEYQQYELEQQLYQQQQTPANNNNNNNNNNNDQPMEPSIMDTGYIDMNFDINPNNIRAHKINNPNNRDLENQLFAMTIDELYTLLKEYDLLQDKYHTILLLPRESKKEVTTGGRDGSAYVLRCLKMWYELPSDVLFSAMSLVDRFLDRMTVKPKHMACMSVASFHLAIKQLGLKPIPAEDLVTISQCGCTAGDLERMANVIANKLGVQMNMPPVTSVSILRIYYALFRILSKNLCPEFAEFYERYIKLEDLENRLEVLLCNVQTTFTSPGTLALVLICLHLDFHIKASYTKGRPELRVVFDYILFLQKFMKIPDRVFCCGFNSVADILVHYNGQNKQPYKQRLVWKLSSRTLRVLRPTNRFSSDLPTIEEGISNNMDDGCRSRTESFSSEEEEDWPTSPIIPIFEQC